MNNPPVNLRIGITTRYGSANGYDEPRDCLARNWINFMQTVLPECAWMALPNSEDLIEATVAKWNLNGFILSGGDDLAQDPVRDKTEMKLLDIAQKKRLPVVGVCRGFQMIQHYFNGPLCQCPSSLHVATRHAIKMHSGQIYTTNSFHGLGIARADLSQELSVLAQSEDEFIEAARAKDLPWLGLMWHPEREGSCNDLDRSLIRSLFGL